MIGEEEEDDSESSSSAAVLVSPFSGGTHACKRQAAPPSPIPSATHCARPVPGYWTSRRSAQGPTSDPPIVRTVVWTAKRAPMMGKDTCKCCSKKGAKKRPPVMVFQQKTAAYKARGLCQKEMCASLRVLVVAEKTNLFHHNDDADASSVVPSSFSSRDSGLGVLRHMRKIHSEDAIFGSAFYNILRYNKYGMGGIWTAMVSPPNCAWPGRREKIIMRDETWRLAGRTSCVNLT